MNNELSIKNLSFSYRNNKVLDNINYDFNINKITVILGLNGCGKTTLLKLLANNFRKYDGEILLNGEKINVMKPETTSKYISFVPQLISDNNDYNVLDYLTFGLVNSIKFYNSPSLEQIKYVKKIAEKFKIEHLLDKKMNQLSGGEKQLINICLAVIQNTPIILMDEPTSALDLNNQYLIMNIIKNLVSDGKTIILSTHNPNICLYLDSFVLLLKEGKVLNSGKAKDIINVETLKQIYGDVITTSEELNYNEITFKQG